MEPTLRDCANNDNNLIIQSIEFGFELLSQIIFRL